jgi:hypothetical protein
MERYQAAPGIVAKAEIFIGKEWRISLLIAIRYPEEHEMD